MLSPQGIWATLNRDDQLSYLGGQGQGRVKGALTILAAYCALREHPLQAGVNSPQQVRSKADDSNHLYNLTIAFFRRSSIGNTSVR